MMKHAFTFTLILISMFSIGYCETTKKATFQFVESDICYDLGLDCVNGYHILTDQVCSPLSASNLATYQLLQCEPTYVLFLNCATSQSYKGDIGETCEPSSTKHCLSFKLCEVTEITGPDDSNPAPDDSNPAPAPLLEPSSSSSSNGLSDIAVIIIIVASILGAVGLGYLLYNLCSAAGVASTGSAAGALSMQERQHILF